MATVARVAAENPHRIHISHGINLRSIRTGLGNWITCCAEPCPPECGEPPSEPRLEFRRDGLSAKPKQRRRRTPPSMPLSVVLSHCIGLMLSIKSQGILSRDPTIRRVKG